MILAIDQGTTGTTSLIVDPNGSVQAKAYREFQQHYPQAGWVEHDADAIWRTVIETASEVLRDRPAPEAIGITNQRETIVVWDRQTGRPAAPAIVWQDRRTARMCEAMKAEGMEAEIRAKTGLVPDPYFSGTKLKWLLSENRDVRALAENGRLAAGTVDSWLLWNLTHGKVYATEPTNASRTLLFNLSRQCWDEELLERFEIPESLLPEVRASAGEFGVTGDGPWGGSSDHGNRRRSTGRTFRPRMPRVRDCEEHIRDGLLPSLSPRQRRKRPNITGTLHGRDFARWGARVRAGRLRLHRGGGGAMAPGRTRIDR